MAHREQTTPQRDCQRRVDNESGTGGNSVAMETSCKLKPMQDMDIERRLEGNTEHFTTNERIVQTKTNDILARMFNHEPLLYVELNVAICDVDGKFSLYTLFRIMQEIAETGLNQLLDFICAQEGNERLVFLSTPLLVLELCCSSSAVVRRVISYPGIVTTMQEIIEENIGTVLQWLSRPYTHMDDIQIVTCTTIRYTIQLVGKFMPFLTQKKGLLAWWTARITQYLDTAREAWRSALVSSPLHMLCGTLLYVNEAKCDLEKNGNIRQPFDVIGAMNHGAYYGVFCSSLKCSVMAWRDGVLPHCSRCMLARYCSRECQKYHWKHGHQKNCWKKGRWVSSIPTCTLIARFMRPTWGPSGADRIQVGPMLAPWTLLSG